MCSDRDLHVARGDQLANVRVLPGADGAREERDPDAELGADALDREEVLLGEDLGRRHEGALPPGLDRPEQRRQRDDGLPGADVALQQPLHRRRAREIAVDLGDRPFLRLGQGEGQHRAVALQELAAGRQRLGDQLLALGRPARERELEDEELVEGEPLPGLLGLCERAGAVQGNERVGPERQGLGGGEPGRERVSLRPDERERLAHERAQLLLRERLACGVDGCVVGGLRHLAEVVALDLEAEAVQLAPQAHARAGSELRLEPRLVEPRRADLAGVVRDPRRQDLEPAAAAPGGDRAHDSFDHSLVLAEEVADRPPFDRPLVPARPVREHVGHGPQAELGEPCPHGRADPRQGLDAAGERLGARGAAWPRPAGRRLQAAEPDRETDLCQRGCHRVRV